MTPEENERFERMLENSSLGTPEAQALVERGREMVIRFISEQLPKIINERRKDGREIGD